MPAEGVDVAIVGGGIAGAAAAEVLSRHGVRVMILDENQRPGGQYLRGGRHARSGWPDRVERQGLNLIDRLGKSPVDVRRRTDVLGIDAGLELLAADARGEVFAIKPAFLLLATGARERFVPFKGWTLPGVLATGAVQILIKQSGILPARSTLVAGAGLFPTAVACDIRKNGGRVQAVFDEMPLSLRIPPPGLLAGHFLKFLQGGVLLARLLRAGVVVRNRTRIVEARGDGRLREVVSARVDRCGNVIPGSAKAHPAECLGVGFGFTANIELAQLAGCGLAFNASLGGWVVKVNEDLETGVDGIWAAGEITAVGGAAKSLVEGRLAGFSILRRMGLLKTRKAAEAMARLKRSRQRQLAFARYFNAQSTLPRERFAAIVQSLPDEVPVCRCEDVTLGGVRKAIAEGFHTPAAVKKATRCGMGICQGGTCRDILLDVLAALTGKPLAHIPLPSVRMPIRPVYLGTLAGEVGL